MGGCLYSRLCTLHCSAVRTATHRVVLCLARAHGSAWSRVLLCCHSAHPLQRQSATRQGHQQQAFPLQLLLVVPSRPPPPSPPLFCLKAPASTSSRPPCQAPMRHTLATPLPVKLARHCGTQVLASTHYTNTCATPHAHHSQTQTRTHAPTAPTAQTHT